MGGTLNCEDENQPSLGETARRVVFEQGWDRLLVVENISSSLIRVRRRTDRDESDFSETDIVGLFSEQEFLAGKLSKEMIRVACRGFLIDRSLI